MNNFTKSLALWVMIGLLIIPALILADAAIITWSWWLWALTGGITAIFAALFAFWGSKLITSKSITGMRSYSLSWSSKLASSRVIQLFYGVIILIISVGASWIVVGDLSVLVVWVSIGAFATMGLDTALLFWRVAHGSYGENRFEAEELLAFMAQRGGGDDGPRHALRRRTKREEQGVSDRAGGRVKAG